MIECFDSKTTRRTFNALNVALCTTILLAAGATTFGCSPSVANASVDEHSESDLHTERGAPPPDDGPMEIEVVITPKSPDRGRPILVDVRLPRALWGATVKELRCAGRRGATILNSDASFRFLFSVAIESNETSVPLSITLQSVDGAPVVIERRLDIGRGDYEESHLKVARKFMSPSKKQRRRSAAEKKDLSDVLAAPSIAPFINGPFVAPVDSRKTASFGTLRTYNKRRDRSRHLGLDLDGKTGDPVVATQRGRVALAQDRFYSGGTVVIDHGESLFSLYLHLSAMHVKADDVVDAGAHIGNVGATGRVTGPHLHFAVKLDDEYLDPEALLALAGVGTSTVSPSDAADSQASPQP